MSTVDLRRHVDPRTLDRLTRLDLRARLVVEGFLTGQHRSPYNGFAVEFATHREYTPGDDIKHIDWKVWSKTDRLYIKEYEEETNLKCTIILDASKSMAYGEKWSKYDYGATAAASLAHLLQQQQDAVGLLTFHNKVVKYLPPSSHPNHWRLMIQELEQTKPSDKSDVRDVFLQLAGQIKQRGLIVLVSDLFVDTESLAEAIKQFRLRRHEVLVFHVMHDDELKFPFQENTLFKGLETTDQLFTEPRALRKSYLDAVESFLARVRGICSASGVDYIPMNTSQPLDAALAGYLSFRQKARRIAARRPGG